MQNAQANHRILVVDDNPAIHSDFQKIFRSETAAEEKLEALAAGIFGENPAEKNTITFELHFASQGQEALELVRKAAAEGRPFAMAFMDVRMPPGWDGIETTSRIWEVTPDLQVAICTAFSDYNFKEITRKLGRPERFVILKKPFETIEVMQLANAFTEKWNLLRQLADHTRELEVSRAQLEERVKERTRELEETHVQLRQSQKLEAIGQLAAGIAHEINTPTQYVGDNTRFFRDAFAEMEPVLKNHGVLLSAAKNSAITPELLAEAGTIAAASDLPYLFEQVPTAIKETLEGVERITKIVRAMKEFSHPGGKEKTAADINKAIESTVTVARNEWKYVAEMKLDLAPELPPVPCFLGEFNQSILNLIVNAAHAIGDVVRQKPGSIGAITVSTRRDGDHVEIRVSDTGTGIPEAIRPHVFEPFFTTKEVGKGTGQGLNIVYGCVVKKHGGAVRFETELGKGTTFILRLPLSARSAEDELPQTECTATTGAPLSEAPPSEADAVESNAGSPAQIPAVS